MDAADRRPMMLAKISVLQAVNRKVERIFELARKEPLGTPEAGEGPMKTVLIYVDTSKRRPPQGLLKKPRTVSSRTTARKALLRSEGMTPLA